MHKPEDDDDDYNDDDKRNDKEKKRGQKGSSAICHVLIPLLEPIKSKKEKAKPASRFTSVGYCIISGPAHPISTTRQHRPQKLQSQPLPTS